LQSTRLKFFEISSTHSYTSLVQDPIVNMQIYLFIFFALCYRKGSFSVFRWKKHLGTLGVNCVSWIFLKLSGVVYLTTNFLESSLDMGWKVNQPIRLLPTSKISDPPQKGKSNELKEKTSVPYCFLQYYSHSMITVHYKFHHKLKNALNVVKL